MSSNFVSHIETQSDTIADGATASGGVKVKGKRAIGIILPSGMEGTNVNIEVTFDDGSNFHSVFDTDGTQVQVQTADVGYNAIEVNEGLEHVRAVADTAQTGSASLTWVFRP